TTFILGFPQWHGDLTEMAPVLRQTDDEALRSGLCAAVGTLAADPAAVPGGQETVDLLADLFREAPDRATHAAAGGALRRWQVPPPGVEPTRGPAKGRHWFVNQLGMTLVEVSPGTFTMGDPRINDAPPHLVTLTQTFWVADTEVTVDRYKRFMEDPAARKPQD